MELLSKDLQLLYIEKQMELFKGFLAFEMEHKGKLDLIPRDEVKEELGVTGETLRRWEAMGLKRYTSPMERTRKVYYRPSDIYKFLSVE